MRRPLESAVIRRDDRLVRTRRLSRRIAGGAAVASLGLAGALGIAIPGHAVAAGTRAPAARPDDTGGHAGAGDTHRHGLGRPAAPPSAPPSSSTPTVSSGGS